MLDTMTVLHAEIAVFIHFQAQMPSAMWVAWAVPHCLRRAAAILLVLGVACLAAAVCGGLATVPPVAFNTQGRLQRSGAPVGAVASWVVPVYQGLSLLREVDDGLEPVLVKQQDLEMEEEPVWLGSCESGALQDLQEKFGISSTDGVLVTRWARLVGPGGPGIIGSFRHDILVRRCGGMRN